MPDTPHISHNRTGFRLSLQYSFLYTILVTLIFVVAFLLSQHELREWAHEWMWDDAESFVQMAERDGSDALIASIEALGRINLTYDRIYALVDADGVVIAGNAKVVNITPLRSFYPIEAFGVEPADPEETTGYWVQSIPINGYTIIQGTSDHVIYELLEALRTSLILGVLAFIAVGLYLGTRVGKLTGDRIAAISDTLDMAGQGDLSSRVPAGEGPKDDLERVGRKINDTLERIERLVDVQKQITTDIAHDLRSPLQRLRQRLEKIDPDTDFDMQRDASLDAIDEIVETFQSLLRIAELERGRLLEDHGETDVGKVLATVLEIYEDTAFEAGQTLVTGQLDAGLPAIPGNANLLAQMFANLIENAITHCPGGSTITVSAVAVGSGLRVTIADNGPGIPLAERERVFDRFYRSDPSRYRKGNGLGLSLAKAISTAHGGDLSLANVDTGACFVWVWPADLMATS